MKKRFISILVCLAVACSIGLSACGGGNNNGVDENPDDTVVPADHEHEWIKNAKASTAATCGEDGITYYVCTGCDETYSEVVKATGEHTYGNNNVCDVCGYIDMSGLTESEAIAAHGFYHVDADNSKTYTTGDTVSFGSYPQELVGDETVLAALDAKAGVAPTVEDAGDWISYGYYSESVPTDYMFYKDVESDGVNYRGVYLLGYRPYYSNLEASGDYSYIDDSGYDLNTVYWFEYSPIVWNVLEYKSGRLLVNAERCLEGQPFQALYEGDADSMVIPGTQTPVNDWENSTLRSFLNNDFYGVAFNEAERALIPTVTLDNRTSGYGADSAYQIIQNDTEDNVFLLSYQDVVNQAYGFTSLARSFTDYSTIQGLRPSGEANTASGDPACSYVLRSAGNKSYLLSAVSKQGTLSFQSNSVKVNTTDSYDSYAVNGDLGVLPALYIKVGAVEWEEHSWEYENASGETVTLDYAVCFPKSYSSDKEALPLITYIPDSSYMRQGIAKVEAAALPTYWVTEEMLEKYPAVYLVLTLTGNSSTDSSSGDYLEALNSETSEEKQVINIIDHLCEEYNIDTERLYLTGQSMGGIFDFAVNTVYPDKFAATVYVSCQPGGEIPTEEAPVPMYDEIIEQAKFANQKFVYIASRKDPKAPVGQDDVQAVLDGLGIEYGEDYTLDPTDPEQSSETLRELFKSGYDHYFVAFPQVAGGGNMEHMASFPLAYQIEALLEWLLEQSLVK